MRVFVKGKNKEGEWMTLKNEIDGLSPEEIKDKLALPSVPTEICDVTVRKGSIMRKSYAGSNEYGEGGGLQYQINLSDRRDWGKDVVRRSTQNKGVEFDNGKKLEES